MYDSAQPDVHDHMDETTTDNESAYSDDLDCIQNMNIENEIKKIKDQYNFVESTCSCNISDI